MRVKYKAGRYPLGARVRAVRTTIGMTQIELARRVGVCPQMIHLIEHGYHRTVHIVELALALDVDPRWLALGIGKAPLLSPARELRRRSPLRVVGESEPRRSAAEEAHRIWSSADIKHWSDEPIRNRA